jgi:hypothetical protein
MADIDRPAKVLVAYYSATAHVHALARAVGILAARGSACGQRLARAARVIGTAQDQDLVESKGLVVMTQDTRG